jgi:Cdc6-like AAA superfamily ATPase
LVGVSSLIASKSNYELIKRLKEEAKHHKLIICLDYFEALEEVETINIPLGLSLTVIIIANLFEDYKRLDQSMKASIANIISIPEYSKDQVFEILNERAEAGFRKI